MGQLDTATPGEGLQPQTRRETGERVFRATLLLLPGLEPSACLTQGKPGAMLSPAVNATTSTYRFSWFHDADDGRTATFTLERSGGGRGAAPYDRRLSDALDWAHWIEDHAEDLASAKVGAGFASWAILDAVMGGEGREAA